MSSVRAPSRAEWAKTRYALFESKIEAFRGHPKYEWLRKYANDAKFYNEGSGYWMIKAENFIERIEQADREYISNWLKSKNQLEWAEIRKEIM